MEISSHWRLKDWRLGNVDMWKKMIEWHELAPGLKLAQLISEHAEEHINNLTDKSYPQAVEKLCEIIRT